MIPNKGELQQIEINHPPDIDIKNLMKIYKKWTEKPYLCLVNDKALLSDNSLCFRKNITSKLS